MIYLSLSIISVYLLISLFVLSTVWVVQAYQHKRSLFELFAKRTPIRIPLVVGEYIILLQILLPQFTRWDLLENLFVVSLGLSLVTVGVVLAIWARFAMHTNWGVPAQHNKLLQNKLVTHGPFSFSRNPIYVALILMFAGIELALTSWGILALPVVIWYFSLIVQKEETLLYNIFDNEFTRYARRVHRYI